MAIDPGNSISTASDLGTLSVQKLKNQIGKTDRFDFYRFTLTGSSSFKAQLKGLKASADMALLSNSGTLLQQNKKPGKQNEAINTALAAGTYYVRIKGSNQTTPYRLNLFATGISNTAPVLSGSLALNALRGSLTASSTAIGSSSLNATDSQQAANQLTYTITTAPKSGSVYRSGVLLSVGNTFTQADVNSGLISYQQQAIKALPNSTGIASAPVISGKNAAWVSGTGTSAEVYFYNGTTGVTTQLTSNSREDTEVQISGNTVVWSAVYSSTDTDIQYSVNGAAPVTVNNSASFDDFSPQISGNSIAFKRNDNSGTNVAGDGVYLYDIGTGVTTQVNGSVESVYSIGVSGANVVWERGFGSESDIQYKLGGSTIQSVNGSTSLDDYSPLISGSYIAFKRNDLSGSNVAGDGIYLYNTSTLTTTQLSTGTEDIYLGGLSGNNVVWQRFYTSGSEGDIFYSLNGSTAVNTINTSTAFDDYSPRISGTNIAFVRDDKSGTSNDGVHLFNASTSSITHLSANASDAIGGIDGQNLAWRSGSSSAQAFFYDGTTTSDSFGFTVSDGSLSTSGTLNITIG